MAQKVMTMKVTRTKEIVTSFVKANGDEIDKTQYVLDLVDRSGATRATLISPEPWEGVRRNMVLDVNVKNSQTSLKEFDPLTPKPKKGKSA